LFTLTASVCLAWYFEGAAFSFGFWGDLLFQVWNLGLLVFTVLTVSRFNLSIKRGLIIATSLLIIKHGIQVYNLFHPGEPSPFLLAVIPSLVVIYFYLMISTLHRKIISDLLASDQEKNRIREKGHQDALRALINSLEAKDIYTRGHSDRVTEYAMVIGQKLGLPEEDLAKLYYGAILHDIGKIGISEGILNNPLSLCHDDFNCIKKHPEIGATIVSSIDSLKNIGPSILYHHERYDGSGYPMGLRGKEIPLHSRIIAIADALDAMSSKRIYRIPFTEEKAIQELIAGAGTQFDPELVKVLMDAFNIKQSSTGSAVSRSA
jgi:putative nucleotidyltransferase with HDIG domain